jgi:hypothetical protein
LRVIYNFFKNHFWFETGLEFFLLAYIFLDQGHAFDNTFHDAFSHIINHMGDQWVIIPISAVATMCIVFTIWDVHWLHAREVLVLITQFTAVMVFMTFLWHSMSMPFPDSNAKVVTAYSFIVVLRIFFYWIKPLVKYDRFKGGG